MAEINNNNLVNLMKLADIGNSDAQLELGYHYVFKENFKKAAELFRKAADQDNGMAQFMLGFCYLLGRGVPENREEADKWLKKATLLNPSIAENIFKEKYFNSNEYENGKEQVIEWIAKSIEIAKKDYQEKGENKKVKQFDKKEFFAGIWALTGRNAFPVTLREEYIETLWKNHEESKEFLIKKELLLLDVSEVFKKIIVYDKELNLFKQFVERFYLMSPKAIRLLKTPAISPQDKKKLQGLENKSYKVIDEATEDKEDWSIQEVQQLPGKKTKIIMSRPSARLVKGKLKEKDIKKEIWDKLEAEVKIHFNRVVDALQDIMVTVTAPYKFQVGIEFDWENETTEMLSDVSEWNEDEGKPGVRQAVRTDALSFLAKKLDLKNKGSFSSIDADGEIKDPTLRTKLERKNTANYLVVMRGGSYHIKGTATENEEDVKAQLLVFNETKIISNAKNYFMENGTFSGFFNKYTKHDRKNTKIQGKVLAGDNPLGCHGLFIKIFDSIEPTSKRFKDTYLENKEIEAVSFEFRDDSGEWIIRTPNYSRRVRDAFIAELNKLSKKQSGGSKPAAGKAP
ncbi:MAG: sel1 repeat family protein [Treponema sp.]|nr:sel1 repeat family protein [Treponema sp.]